MGSCSNRGETRDETLGRFTKKVNHYASQNDAYREGHYSNFQSTVGAEIRGKLGVDKGNQFIKDMSKY